MSQICHNLHHLFNNLPLFSFPFDESKIPQNGIYILFEAGEYAHGTNRIVRIGTHTGNNQLLSRLKQHFIKENKDRSIFRKNIGRVILNRAKDSYLAKWDLKLTTREDKKKFLHLIDPVRQKQIEQQVTSLIQKNFSFVVFQVNSKERRLFLESRIISTVSLCQDCKPSANWFGNYSTKSKIRESGLWQVNELYKQPFDEIEFETFEQAIKNNSQKFI